jgi:hypothetical protein
MSKDEKSKGKATVDLVGSQIGKSGTHPRQRPANNSTARRFCIVRSTRLRKCILRPCGKYMRHVAHTSPCVYGTGNAGRVHQHSNILCTCLFTYKHSFTQTSGLGRKQKYCKAVNPSTCHTLLVHLAATCCTDSAYQSICWHVQQQRAVTVSTPQSILRFSFRLAGPLKRVIL